MLVVEEVRDGELVGGGRGSGIKGGRGRDEKGVGLVVELGKRGWGEGVGMV